MDESEATKTVYGRIKIMEPERATRIMGYLLFQEADMDCLAMATDGAFQDAVNEARAHLEQMTQPSPTPESPMPMEQPSLPPCSSPFLPPPTVTHYPTLGHQYVGGFGPELVRMHDHLPMYQQEEQELAEFLDFEDRSQFMPLPRNMGFPGNCMCHNSGGFHGRSGPLYCQDCDSQVPGRICHFFNKGTCKHGNHCCFFHEDGMRDFHQMHDYVDDDDHHLLPEDAFEILEMEIVELLESRNGTPISIASLPSTYYGKYGRFLRPERYLRVSPRHGKPGSLLTKLIFGLSNRIQLVDMPRGQQAVILSEDAGKFTEGKEESKEEGSQHGSGSRQIYMTFPVESTFTEDDVSDYFKKFGPVDDVRIPCQERRMFGFVSFESSDAVQMVLSQDNPHYICDSRVLVKPYKDKTKLVDRCRRVHERNNYLMNCPPRLMKMKSEFYTMPRVCNAARWVRSQQIEKYELLQRERNQLAMLQMVEHPVPPRFFHRHPMGGLNLAYGYNNAPAGDLDDNKIVKNDSHEDEEYRNDDYNLPENPFTFSC